MSLDLTQVAGLPAGAVDPDLDAKTAALAQFVTDVLALHASTTGAWKAVATYADARLRQLIGRQDGADIMGSPVRYAQVVPIGRLAHPEGGFGPTAPAHVFEVGLYYGTGTDPSDADFTSNLATAHGRFRDVLDATSSSVPGLLYAADRQRELATSGGYVEMGNPTGVEIGAIPGTRQNDEVLACTFTITLS